MSVQPLPPELLEHPLNKAAARLLKLQGIGVSSRTMPLSQAILEEILHWNGPLSHSVRASQRLVRLGDAETPEQFVEALRPFMGPLAWDPKQAETEGLSPFGLESLDQYTPTNLAAEAGKCHNLSELLNILAGQEENTYQLTT